MPTNLNFVNCLNTLFIRITFVILRCLKFLSAHIWIFGIGQSKLSLVRREEIKIGVWKCRWVSSSNRWSAIDKRDYCDIIWVDKYLFDISYENLFELDNRSRMLFDNFILNFVNCLFCLEVKRLGKKHLLVEGLLLPTYAFWYPWKLASSLPMQLHQSQWLPEGRMKQPKSDDQNETRRVKTCPISPFL